jgi:hypothetical protein
MTRNITREGNPNEIIGWVSEGGCANKACKAATRQGRPWHGNPSGFAVTMPTYHFATETEATAAIVATMADIRGLRLDLSVEDRIAWMQEGRK